MADTSSNPPASEPTSTSTDGGRFPRACDITPQPHRCHAHLDDFIAALQTWPLEVRGPWSALWKCHFADKNEPVPPRYVRQQPITFQPTAPEPKPRRADDGIDVTFAKMGLPRVSFAPEIPTTPAGGAAEGSSKQ
ncbi:hypothetical protein AMAG_03779 [Allomyces macrogynus ATCC 38327]|uniref:Uncharacterized protein n=1 Tax=Allomyces macrogynus (strain ATCC 38327) TaxID=578462 RepID=A0A0L0SAC6_ALLM3|nr:hypothetical protein AMAG_03779 [Allomyces macrogynus ATCC 38327]|eukprot:KNE59508.1 hypothetical protein AMAG_03779 [Allomyces macrogynus ATCC 38327]